MVSLLRYWVVNLLRTRVVSLLRRRGGLFAPVLGGHFDRFFRCIVTIDINDITGGYVLISWPDIALKWDIIKKIDTSIDTENKTAFTYYEARFNLANVQANSGSIVTIVQDMKDSSLNIAIHNPSVENTTWYYKLNKITY